MKNTILVLLLLSLVGYQTSAQVSQDVEVNGMQIFTKEKEPKKATGSPFYENDFVWGKVIDDDTRQVQMLMRYNAVEDIVVLRPNPKSEEEYVLPKKRSITYNFGNYTYFIDGLKTNKGFNEGFYAKFYEGENSKFVGQPVADITPAKVASTGYQQDKPAHMKVEMVYYISIDGKPFQEVRIKEKDLEDLFDSEKMEDYFDDKKIKTEDDVIAMLKYYDSM